MSGIVSYDFLSLFHDRAVGSLESKVDHKQERDLRQLLPSMPVDVVLEIMTHIHPSDLLQLSRTTKLLRFYLMHPSARFVWRASLSTVVDLPPCPPDLSEPQYVNLIYSKHCHFCLAEGIESVFWRCRVRCCEKCVYDQFITSIKLERKIPEAMRILRYDDIFPSIIYPPPGPNRRRTSTLLYYLPAVDQYVRELQIIENSGETLQQWSAEKKKALDSQITHARLWESLASVGVSTSTTNIDTSLFCDVRFIMKSIVKVFRAGDFSALLM